MPIVTVPLLRVSPATPRSLLLTLQFSNHSAPFLAGQAVVVGRHGQERRRPYSIACSPEQAAEGTLELLVGVDSAGSPGEHLDPVAPGVSLDVEGPLGSFTFPESIDHARVLFIAGGAGIAPIRAMLDHARRAHSDTHLALLYSARRSDEFAFIDELRDLQDAGHLELHQTVTRDDMDWGGNRGRIGQSHFEAALHDPTSTLCFVCGPAAMVSESVATLGRLGVPGASIRTENWVRR